MSRLLGVDFGKSRIGLAISEGELVLPLDPLSSQESSVNYVAELAQSRGVTFIIVGLPLSLSGAPTASTNAAIDFARQIAQHCDVEVRMVDERLTTVSAQSRLRETGKSFKESKSSIDSESAAEILRFTVSQIRLGKKPGIGLEEIEH